MVYKRSPHPHRFRVLEHRRYRFQQRFTEEKVIRPSLVFLYLESNPQANNRSKTQNIPHLARIHTRMELHYMSNQLQTIVNLKGHLQWKQSNDYHWKTRCDKDPTKYPDNRWWKQFHLNFIGICTLNVLGNLSRGMKFTLLSTTNSYNILCRYVAIL